MISTFITLSFSRAPCNLAEGPPLRNFGLSNEGGLGLLSSDVGFAHRQPLAPIGIRGDYRVGPSSLSNQPIGFRLL